MSLYRGDYNIIGSHIRFLIQSADRKNISHESERENLLDEAMSKTGFGVNRRLGSVGITITTNKESHIFVFYDDENCVVNTYGSTITSPAGEVVPFDMQLEVGSLMLYGII